MNQKRWTRVLPQQLSRWKQNRKPYILRLFLDVNFRVWSWWAGKPWKRPLRILKAKLWTFASENWGVFHTLGVQFLEPLKDELDAENLNKLWCFHGEPFLVCIPWCPQTVCPNLGVQGGGTSCAECRPMQIPGMDQNLKSCDVRWNGMLLILTLGCFSPPWQWGKRWSLKDVGLLYCLLLLWVTGMVGEHPKSQCVGFDKAMYSNLGCPRGVDAWVRWRFVALVQAKKICDALAPWVLRDIEALNTVWALTFQRYGLLRLPNVQHKRLFTAFHVMSLKFSTTHTISHLFSCVKNIHKISQTKLGCLPGEPKRMENF